MTFWVVFSCCFCFALGLVGCLVCRFALLVGRGIVCVFWYAFRGFGWRWLPGFAFWVWRCFGLFGLFSCGVYWGVYFWFV